MREADYIVDIGPGAGEHGGEVVAQGNAEEIMANKNSITGAYLSGRKVSCTQGAGKTYRMAEGDRSQAEQSEEYRCAVPAGSDDLRDRRFRLREKSLVNEILYKRLAKN